MIAACSKDMVIGNNGVIPWNIPSDLKSFKNYTNNKIVIMGRVTFQSLPVFLNNRISIVITSNLEQVQDKVSDLKKQYGENNVPPIIVSKSIGEALDLLSVILEKYSINKDEVVVIGGESIYRQFLPITSKIILSLVDGEFDGDKYFPILDNKIWKKVTEEKVTKDVSDSHNYSILIFESLESNVYDFFTGNLLSKINTFKYL